MAKLGPTISNVIRGDTRTVNLTFKQSDGTTAVNLAGGTVTFRVNAESDPVDNSNASISKSATSFTSASTGQHTFTLTHSDTDIDAGTYWYDAQFVDSTGGYLSSYRGKFIVQSDIDRS